METRKPGDLLKMFREGGNKRKAALKAAHFTVPKVKHSGKFHGKSNALGHGGRAAQLRAAGVPGGIIGEMARRAHAAPGQKNYHGKRKVAAPEKENLGLALKRSKHMKRSKGATHIHVHFHGDMPQGMKQEREEKSKHEFKHAKMKHMKPKNASHGTKDVEVKEQGRASEEKEEDEKEFKGKKHKAVCMKCKGAHPTHEHGKKKASA